MVSRSSSFRVWLEKLPLPDWSIPRVLDLYFKRRDGGHVVGKDDAADREYFMKLLEDITYDEPRFSRPVFAGWSHIAKCGDCHVNYPRFLMRSKTSYEDVQ